LALVVKLDIGAVKYMSFDSMVALWLKIIQIGFACQALKAQSRIMTFAHL